jgi:hypothetical protein
MVLWDCLDLELPVLAREAFPVTTVHVGLMMQEARLIQQDDSTRLLAEGFLELVTSQRRKQRRLLWEEFLDRYQRRSLHLIPPWPQPFLLQESGGISNGWQLD